MPGYAEAVRREEELRAVPFLGVGERVAGLPVAPLTLRRVQWLTLVRSPFLTRLTADVLLTKPDIADDIVLFLWIVSPGFEAGNDRAKKRFYKTHGEVMAAEALKVIQELLDYVAEAFLDAGCETLDDRNARSYYAEAAGLVVFFHHNFGLQIDVWENSRWRNLVRKLTGQPNVLDIPLRLAFQLVRAHQRSKNPEVTFYNRLSQPKIDAWLTNLNQPQPKRN